METTGHGEAVLVLSVDVNENEEAGTSYSSHVARNFKVKSHQLDRSRACPVNDAGQSGNSYVYIASNGRASIIDCVVLPSHNPPVGNTTMLDMVSELLPSEMNERCVISDLYNDHRYNRFNGTDREGALSYPGTASCPYRQEGGNRMLRQLGCVSDGEGLRDCLGETRDLKSAPQTVVHSNIQPGPLCDKQSCICTASEDLDMKISNGDVDCYLSNDDWSTDVDTDYCSQLNTNNRLLYCQDLESSLKEVKVANGGLHILNPEATCDFVAVSSNVPLNAVTFNPQLQNIPSPLSPCESSVGCRHVIPEDVLTDAKPDDVGSSFPNPEDVPSESSANPPSPCLSTLSEITSNTESSTREDLTECCLPARPLTLRTNPHTPISLSCDSTPLGLGDGNVLFMDEGCTNCQSQSAPEKLLQGLTSLSSSTKFGVSEFFNRHLFSRKPKEAKATSQNSPGWKLFGKVPVRENTTIDAKDSFTIQQERPSPHPQAQLSAARRKNLEFEPLSTTALILEDRPANLPAKSVEEAVRHKQEYDQMVAGARKREMKEAQRKKRQMKERFKQEDSIANAMVTWNNNILPNWDCMRNTRRVRDLWWQGLPPGIRGRVWSLAISNELNITPELYEIFLSRAKERWGSFSEIVSENEAEDVGSLQADRESSLDLIKLDISRTFPYLFIFQKGGPYHDILQSVLGAYTCYRPDVGYVQGMSFIAAVLILNLEGADPFIAFANLLNKPCQMAFFRLDHDMMMKYFAAFEVFFEENLPRLFSHFQINNLTPDLYLIDWIFTLYSKSLPLDVACRVWDVFSRDGEEFLFRTGLGILRLYHDVLLQMDFIHMAKFLTRLPESMATDNLFSCIAATHMISNNRKWGQVFSALMRDGNKEMVNHSPASRS